MAVALELSVCSTSFAACPNPSRVHACHEGASSTPIPHKQKYRFESFHEAPSPEDAAVNFNGQLGSSLHTELFEGESAGGLWPFLVWRVSRIMHERGEPGAISNQQYCSEMRLCDQ